MSKRVQGAMCDATAKCPNDQISMEREESRKSCVSECMQNSVLHMRTTTMHQTGLTHYVTQSLTQGKKIQHHDGLGE